ncbi:hypothetical protein C2845_PM06G15660 [Panicum miliaceum]|uniref:RNase H type-1 domain-containing protein n=1 Tax=Panicum miliaceum TaxID=4540 RepID=A0A3L6R721_PANMI|nr:hypothetical protein C2845_PM06G15660 [Panicum miliaceum]
MQVSADVLSLPKKKKLLIVGLLWLRWDVRNKANGGDSRRTTGKVTYEARMVTQQLQDAANAKGVQMTRTYAPRWTLLPPYIWKINVNAAFWANVMQGAWGFVICDHQGIAVLAGAGRLDVVRDVLCAESYACIEAFQVSADQVCSASLWRLILRPY